MTEGKICSSCNNEMGLLFSYCWKCGTKLRPSKNGAIEKDEQASFNRGFCDLQGHTFQAANLHHKHCVVCGSELKLTPS